MVNFCGSETYQLYTYVLVPQSIQISLHVDIETSYLDGNRTLYRDGFKAVWIEATGSLYLPSLLNRGCAQNISLHAENHTPHHSFISSIYMDVNPESVHRHQVSKIKCMDELLGNTPLAVATRLTAVDFTSSRLSSLPKEICPSIQLCSQSIQPSQLTFQPNVRAPFVA